jgi:hypothetical protein
VGADFRVDAEGGQDRILCRDMNIIARSPTQTVTWGTCPVKRALVYGLGLRPRRVMHSEIAAIGGKAWAVAMQAYNEGRRDGQEISTDDLVEVALVSVQVERALFVTQGREIPDWEQAYSAGIEARVEHAIRKYVKADPLLDYQIKHVELTLPDHGNARIDLGVRDDFGPSVVDYKFKLRLDARYYDKTVEEYRNNWQQFHYGWAYGEYLGEPINNYMICLVVAEPKFSVKLHEFPIHPEAMEAWKASAQRIWTQMDHEDAGLVQPWMATEHASKWGPCEYQKACFDHRWDMDLMRNSGDYVVVNDAP